MVELVDTLDSKSGGLTAVSVRLRLLVPIELFLCTGMREEDIFENELVQFI